MEKKYGLVLPAKTRRQAGDAQERGAPSSARRAAFGDEDDFGEDDGDGDKPHNRKSGGTVSSANTKARSGVPSAATLQQPPPPPAASKASLSLYEQMHAQALAEDATAFDYDAVYDSMKGGGKRAAAEEESEEPVRAARYVGGMLEQAERRAKNEMRVLSSKFKRERERETGAPGEFEGLEEFTTGAYREHLDKVQILEAEEALVEEKEDVTKRRDHMAGFYRALLDKKVGLAPKAPAVLLREAATEEEEEVRPAQTAGKGAAPRSYAEEAVVGLQGGLNAMKSRKLSERAGSGNAGRHGRYADGGYRRESGGAKSRVSASFEAQMLQQQYEEKLAREQEERAKAEEEHKLKFARRTDTDAVAAARERAAQRRRERMAATE